MLTVEEVARLPVAELCARVPTWLCEHVADEGDLRGRVEERVGAALARVGEAALSRALERYRTLGDGYDLFHADPATREVGRAFIGELLPGSPRAEGLEHLDAAIARGPCLVVSNHVSYADGQLTDRLLCEAGGEALADRLVFVSGPKVYTEPLRRMAVLCLNSLKTAQSTRLEHNEAGQSPREVLRIAKETVRRAGALMEEGHPVLLYPEGGRSRTGRLRPFLKAASRYAGPPAASIVPFAFSGGERVFPLHQRRLHPASVALTIGEPVPVAGSDALAALRAAWHRIAALLPEDRRPEPATDAIA